ncbi:Cu-oxidase domain-containing protein/Cu-oxidase_2 domain-containing protein/Cu-oxidase_3 domain-containing protein [Cephalotus follicularis]|uniref:Cu-oxidase domain-containing protein/Cu-oxidase_2 domain-containing protein/Cu-oxidase_3 domain-containing protein n=1 Tax=Cephalotus follicularis TaxID=3775 RepID=A0A1Q3BCE6_CEPFO|nr:Cu-oxidase domain-containing protein/Cu-oxidase_2 domain-containing protein/Cu-oxidase_3 domain-containing protein [Cephalotus follicularis]
MFEVKRIWVFNMIFLALSGLVTTTWADGLIDLKKLEMFVDELPDMPKIQGFDVVNGVPKTKSLKIGMYQKLWTFHRDLPSTPVFAYGISREAASVPGPTIEALHGIDTHVTWQNHLPSKHILPWDPTIPTAIPRSRLGIPTVVHLHGAIDEPESDGNAKSWFTAGFRERGPMWTKTTYHYRNMQHPGNLWYHDHAMGLTRVNLLAGLIGAYVIRHPGVEDPLGLPSGDEFDRPLVVFDRGFNADGSIYMNRTGNNPSIHPQWRPEYFGDAIVVNGKAWPRVTVRRRKYRFRIRNASNARFFKFFFTNGLRFIHVASDSAYLEEPISTNETLLGPSEIADVVVDFSKSMSDTAILANGAPYPYPGGDPVNEANGNVMKFVIKNEPEVDMWRVPKTLIKYPRADLSGALQTRYIVMYEYTSVTGEPTHLYINGKSYDDPVTETPKVGTSEVWNVINLTQDNHPLHIHLGLFKVLDQTELVNEDRFKACMTKINDAIKCNITNYTRGKNLEVPAHEKGWKNVYKITPGYVTKILVRFSYIHSNATYPFDATKDPGYVYHCHILDHEDNVMIRPLRPIQ